MTGARTTAAPTGREKIAQGKERSDAALGNASPNTPAPTGRKMIAQGSALGSLPQNQPSPEGAKEGSELPSGWRWVNLPDIGELSRGKSKHRPRNEPQLYGGPHPFIQTGDIRESGGTIRTHSQTYSELGLSQSRLWPAGTLCITIAANIGETAILSYPACFPDSVVGFRHDGDPATVRFIELYFRIAKIELERMAPATAQKNINVDILSKLPIPLPPLPEQRRIVAEIEKQFTRLEAGVAALRRVQANLKRYRASVLKAACEGRLVPTEDELARQRANPHPGGVRDISRGLSASDTPSRASPEFIHPGGVVESAAGSGIPSGCGDALTAYPGVSSRPALLNPRLISGSPPGFPEADYETGAALLARILTERRQNWQGRGQYKEPAAPDTANLPPLPEGWKWVSFDQVCDALSDERKKVAKADYLPAGSYPVIDQGEEHVGGYSNDEALLFSGSLPVILFGDHTRRFKLATDRFTVGADGVKLVGLTEAWDAKFLWYQFQQLEFEDRGYSRHFQFVRKVPLRLPPLAEQTRIVAEVERRLSVVEELESVVSANLQRATRLRQSILQKAFTGNL